MATFILLNGISFVLETSFLSSKKSSKRSSDAARAGYPFLVRFPNTYKYTMAHKNRIFLKLRVTDTQATTTLYSIYLLFKVSNLKFFNTFMRRIASKISRLFVGHHITNILSLSEVQQFTGLTYSYTVCILNYTAFSTVCTYLHMRSISALCYSYPKLPYPM